MRVGKHTSDFDDGEKNSAPGVVGDFFSLCSRKHSHDDSSQTLAPRSISSYRYNMFLLQPSNPWQLIIAAMGNKFTVLFLKFCFTVLGVCLFMHI